VYFDEPECPACRMLREHFERPVLTKKRDDDKTDS
jgi:hypothetical protein